MQYLDNVLPMNPKSVDLGGGPYHAFISHAVDAQTLHLLLTEKFKKGTRDQLTVEEITKKTLKPGGPHFSYVEQVQNRFVKFDEFPNIGKLD